MSNSVKSVAVSSHLEQEKQQRFKRMHSKLTICLHVKSTQRKAATDSTVPLKDRPLYPSILDKVSLKKDFDGIEDLVLEVVKTSKFKTKYGENAVFDSDIGIIGWRGSRQSRDDKPSKCLSNKESVEICSTKQWKSHCDEFGYRVEDEKSQTKYTLVDIGIAVYDEEKER